jgi:hypothetical protein
VRTTSRDFLAVPLQVVSQKLQVPMLIIETCLLRAAQRHSFNQDH